MCGALRPLLLDVLDAVRPSGGCKNKQKPTKNEHPFLQVGASFIDAVPSPQEPKAYTEAGNESNSSQHAKSAIRFCKFYKKVFYKKGIKVKNCTIGKTKGFFSNRAERHL